MAISGSPTAPRCCRFSAPIRSSESRWQPAIDARGAGHVQDRVALGAERHALVRRRQEAAGPVGRAAADARSPRTARRSRAGRRTRCPARRSTHAPMLGRPNCGEPVLRKICAGAWLNCVGVDRLDDRDVVDDPRQVRQQLRELGAGLAVAGEAVPRPSIRLASGRMNANRCSLTTSAGIGWPSCFRRAGLSSNRSSWLGAPAMNRKMTRRARGEVGRAGRHHVAGDRRRIGLGAGPRGAGLRPGQQGRQRDLADADAAVTEEVAAGQEQAAGAAEAAGLSRDSAWHRNEPSL